MSQRAQPRRAPRLPSMVGIACALVAAGGPARAQDATVTVHLKNAGVGAFGATGTIGSKVHVYLRSIPSAQYSSNANIYAPVSGTAKPGATFDVPVPALYSPAKAPNTKYFLVLDWPDTTHKMVSYGPYALKTGMNDWGANGVGSFVPIAVANDAPPAAHDIQCYADQPDPSKTLYLYWSTYVRPEDYDHQELHLSTKQGFTPSPQTLIASPPYGTDFRKVQGLQPSTSYYACVRTVDRYGATSDTCRAAACTTQTAGGGDMTIPPADLAPHDAGGGGGPDFAVPAPDAFPKIDAFGLPDFAPGTDDGGGGGPDLAPGTHDGGGPDLAIGGPGADTQVGPVDLAGGSVPDATGGGGDVDGSSGASDLVGVTFDLGPGGGGDLGTGGGDLRAGGGDGGVAGADLAAASGVDLGPSEMAGDATGCGCAVGGAVPRAAGGPFAAGLLALFALAFARARFARARFVGAQFARARFGGARLMNARFARARFVRASPAARRRRRGFARRRS